MFLFPWKVFGDMKLSKMPMKAIIIIDVTEHVLNNEITSQQS